MDTLESTTQSFIVKVWAEESVRKDGQGVWHGHITHVPTGQRRYLKNLSEIQDFIAPHLEEMGVKLGLRWRVRRWFKHVIKRGNR
jgi:hypothetical protein